MKGAQCSDLNLSSTKTILRLHGSPAHAGAGSVPAEQPQSTPRTSSELGWEEDSPLQHWVRTLLCPCRCPACRDSAAKRAGHPLHQGGNSDTSGEWPGQALGEVPRAGPCWRSPGQVLAEVPRRCPCSCSQQLASVPAPYSSGVRSCRFAILARPQRLLCLISLGSEDAAPVPHAHGHPQPSTLSSPSGQLLPRSSDLESSV